MSSQSGKGAFAPLPFFFNNKKIKTMKNLQKALEALKEIRKIVSELQKVETFIRRANDGCVHVYHDEKIIVICNDELSVIKEKIISSIVKLLSESNLAIISINNIAASKDYDELLKALVNAIFLLEKTDDDISNYLRAIERLSEDIELLEKSNANISLPYRQDFINIGWICSEFKEPLLEKKKEKLKTTLKELDELLSDVVR